MDVWQVLWSHFAWWSGIIPVTHICHSWSSSGVQYSRLQMPLKLAWAVTIHKLQGLILNKVVVEIGKREFSSGLTFVACSRVCQLRDLAIVPSLSFFSKASYLCNQSKYGAKKSWRSETNVRTWNHCNINYTLRICIHTIILWSLLILANIFTMS